MTETSLSPTLSDVERRSAEAERRVFAKIGWRLMPILIVSYILNYLDRTNVSFAALTMNEAIGLTAAQFGLGSGIFFLGYCLLEVPSNLALYRFGARRWISRIMITWGLVSAAMALAVGPKSFYVLQGAARRRGGRLLSRGRLLSGDVVPRRVPDAHHRVVHGGDPDLVGDRRAGVGPAAANGRRRRPGRMAVAVPRRRPSRRRRRPGPALDAGGHAREHRVAVR